MRRTSEKYRLNSYEGVSLPFENYMKIDNTHLSPEEAAKMIKRNKRSLAAPDTLAITCYVDGDVAGTDELREFRPQVRYQNGEGITLQSVQDAIKDCAMNMGIPVAFKEDQVKSGGLFNSSIEDCIVMYNPEHEKDYFRFCIRVNHQGTYAFVRVNDFGQSKQMNKASNSERAKQGAKDYFKPGTSDFETGQAIGNAIGGFIGSLGKNKAKLEEEEKYYACICDIFDEIVR